MCPRETRIALADLLVVLMLAKLAGMQSLQGKSRLDRRSGGAPAREVAALVETHAVYQYLQVCDFPVWIENRVNEAMAAWFVRKEARSVGAGRNQVG